MLPNKPINNLDCCSIFVVVHTLAVVVGNNHLVVGILHHIQVVVGNMRLVVVLVHIPVVDDTQMLDPEYRHCIVVVIAEHSCHQHHRKLLHFD